MLLIGKWRLNPNDGTLSDGSESSGLSTHALDVLLYLSAHPGRLVSADELIDKLWPGQVATDNAVYKIISELRRSLQDTPRNPRYIKTVSKKGYVLIAPVQDERASRAVVAVLPFMNMTRDPGNAYLSDGISEEILNSLAQQSGFDVIARSSSFQFRDTGQDMREVGRALGATHLIEGSVRVHGDRVRVTAQLILSDRGTHLWSRKYDRNIIDLFALQDEIAEDIAEAILPHLGDRAPRVAAPNAEAYNLFMQGRALLESGNPFDVPRAIEKFEAGANVDPGFVDARLYLARSHMQLAEDWVGLEPPIVCLEVARPIIEDILREHPDEARALTLLHHIAYTIDFDWSRAMALIKRAVELSPEDEWVQYYHGVYLWLTHHPDAGEVLEAAFRKNPLSHPLVYILALQRLFSGRQVEAIRLIDSLLLFDTRNYMANFLVGLLNAFTYRIPAATACYERARAVVGDDYPALKVLKYYLHENVERDGVDPLLEEIAERCEDTYFPLLVSMGWPAHLVGHAWNVAIKQRQFCNPLYLFGERPMQMSPDQWQTITHMTGVDKYKELRDREFLRPAVERAELLAQRSALPEELLVRYVGFYRSQEGSMLRITLDDDQLWATYVDTDDRHMLVPTAPGRFEVYGFYATLEFSENGSGSELIETRDAVKTLYSRHEA